MGWASQYIAKLKEGEIVTFRPRGNSMRGKINSGDLVEVKPIKDGEIINKHDILLCKVKGNEYLHLVIGIKGDRYLIGNNIGGINGWIGKNNIYGKFIKIIK